jgi:hypothetical protein
MCWWSECIFDWYRPGVFCAVSMPSVELKILVSAPSWTLAQHFPSRVENAVWLKSNSLCGTLNSPNVREERGDG